MTARILGGLKEILDALLDAALALLPASPFAAHIQALGGLPYLGYLNWFIPVGTFLAIGTSWLGAVGIFYLVQIILRWIKAIE